MLAGRVFSALVAISAFGADKTFDAASVKPSPPLTGDSYSINLGTARHGEVALSNATLADCFRFAWDLVSEAQLTGPDWITSKQVRFDVVAKAASDTPRSELLGMLRTLLTERFQLRIGTRERNVPHYNLAMSRPRLAEAATVPNVPSLSSKPGHIMHPAIAMQTLAMLLSRQTGEVIVNRTELPGLYTVDLRWTPEKTADNPDPADNGPSLFTALQQQLGLKLERGREPLRVYTIESALREPLSN